MIKQLMLIGLLFWAMQLEAGEQKEEALSNSVKAVMQKSVTDVAAPRLMFADPVEGQAWLTEMSQRLQKKLPDKAYREDFLISALRGNKGGLRSAVGFGVNTSRKRL